MLERMGKLERPSLALYLTNKGYDTANKVEDVGISLSDGSGSGGGRNTIEYSSIQTFLSCIGVISPCMLT